MKMIKIVGAIVGSLFLVGGAQIASAEQPGQIKIAIVNVQQILQQSPRVADLSKKLESQFKPRQTKIGDEQKALQDELDKFKKEEPTLTQKDRDATQKKIASERADLVKQVVAYQQDLQKEQNKIMQSILSDLNGIVTDLAKKDGYPLVLDSQAVIYAIGGNDITKEVAKEFNSKA